MTVTIKAEYIYLSIIVVLMILQVVQWRKIYSLKSEVDKLWNQISVMALSAGAIIDKFKKDLDAKQDK